MASDELRFLELNGKQPGEVCSSKLHNNEKPAIQFIRVHLFKRVAPAKFVLRNVEFAFCDFFNGEE